MRGQPLSIRRSPGTKKMSMADAAESRRVVLVTAASQGIGAGVARVMAQKGHRVALLARSPKVHELAAEIGRIAVSGSVRDEAAVSQLIETAVAEWGRI